MCVWGGGGGVEVGAGGQHPSGDDEITEKSDIFWSVQIVLNVPYSESKHIQAH